MFISLTGKLTLVTESVIRDTRLCFFFIFRRLAYRYSLISFILCFSIQNRSLVQIKSHAQKVLKRLEAGENVFRRLDENSSIIDSLIVQAAKDRDALGRGLASTPKSLSAISKRKSSKALQPPSQPVNTPASDYRAPAESSSFGEVTDAHHVATEFDDGRDSVIAAAALCQLSSLGSSWDRNHQSPLQRSF